MSARVRTWLDERLSAAERDGACLVAHTDCELRRLRRAVALGDVVEAVPAVFARAAYWAELKPAGRARHVMRSLHELHPDWVFAGPSAALAFGLSVSNRYVDKVWVATTRKAHMRELSYRRPIIVSGDEPVTSGGLCLTSFERTVGDCLRIMDFRTGLALADSALRVGRCSRDTLVVGVERACAKMPGLDRMRHVIHLADARAESGGESIARATMLELGFALPELQRAFDRPTSLDDPYRVDFAWDVGGDRCIVGELDGFEKYVNKEMTRGRSLVQVIDGEHRRQSRIEAHPQVARFVRFGFSDIMNDCGFLELLRGSGVPRTFAYDMQVLSSGGILRCR